MPYEFYKWIHLIGFLCLGAALGAQAFYVAAGGKKPDWKFRKQVSSLHGIGLALLVIAGFGMMAKASYGFSNNAWLSGKFVIWLILGAIPVVFWRKPNLAMPIFLTCLALAAVASYLAIFKPF